MKKYGVGIIWGLLIGLYFVQAQALPERAGYINDFAGVLSVQNALGLEVFLGEHEQNTGHMLIVLIVQNLEGLSVEDYAEQITAKWELGDQHLLLLVSLDESAIRISVGAALRQKYPDAALNVVVDAMIPSLALGNFDQGIADAVERLVGFVAEQGKATAIAQPINLLQGPFRLLIIGGVAALSLLLYLLFRA